MINVVTQVEKCSTWKDWRCVRHCVITRSTGQYIQFWKLLLLKTSWLNFLLPGTLPSCGESIIVFIWRH